MAVESGGKRQFGSIGNKLLNIICLAFAFFQLYTAAFGNLDSLRQRSIHLLFAASLVFILVPASKKSSRKKLSLFDITMLICILAPIGYLLLNHNAILNRMYYVTPLEWYEYLFGAMIVVAVLEGTRRIMGPALPVVAIVAITYGFLGQYIPGNFGHSGFNLVEMIDQIYFTTEGIFGVPLGVSATYVILFIIFGAFLQKSGIADYFMDVASALTGRTRGGPAKMAVVASGLFGSISGSALANVATTGQITIPMMKKIGYRPHFAGAVEAVASTGGQIMPPVMGAAVFIMSEYTGIPYITILKNAILPAILYYAAVMFMVHLEAVKTGLKSLSSDELPKIRNLWKRLYLFIPLVVIVGTLVTGFSPMYAVLVSLVSILLVAAIKPETRMGIKAIGQSLINGVRGALEVAMACACAGIIVGIASYTGLGLKITSVLIDVAQGNFTLALIITMVATLILGMGLPTTPAYIVVAALMVPALIKLNITTIAAHLFAFYFANIANITPPVALAAYTAAGLANADAFKTGITAFKLGIAAYIVPFMFVFNPALLLIGISPAALVQAAITSMVGVYFLAAATEGWLRGKTNLLERLLLFGASVMLINPGILTDLMGLVLGGIAMVSQYLRYQVSNSNNPEVSTKWIK
ncbi:MAG: hypothetical protein PWR22_1477 [Moorella sp. (in: firmicutes)]|jgi:TRAP transporter 4TM/12TM fusion protein|nr:hypothetical protein [Moorella sp. (in: firmicutes)]